jgi:anti-sigma factor RsiW
MKRPSCQRFRQLYWDAGPDEKRIAWHRHLAACPACREWHALAQHLDEGLRGLPAPVAPVGLTQQIVRSVLAEQQARRRLRRLRFAAALAAAVLLVVFLRDLRPHPTGPPAFPEPSGGSLSVAPPSPSLPDSMAEAGSAVAALTRRVADETVEETRLVLPRGETLPLPDAGVLQQTLTPPARSLQEAGQVVSAGLDPVVTSAQRAVVLFWREVPHADPAGDPGL